MVGGPERSPVEVASDPVNRDRNAGSNASFAEEYGNDEPADPERWNFELRIVLLLLVAWMILLVFNSMLIVRPVTTGQAVFYSLPLLPTTHSIKCNELYAFIIGRYVIWSALAGVKFCVEHTRRRSTGVLLGQIWKWYGIIVKSSLLLSIWARMGSCR